jgi:hypothetical protein
VPADATGVIANLTVTGTTAASHLTVWPAGTPLPGTSNLNWDAGRTRANLVTARLGSGGIAVRNNTGTVDVVVDVVAWLGPDPSDGRLHRVDPFRLVDTRGATGAPAVALGPGEVLVVDSRRGPIPGAGVSAVIANVTAVAGTAASHLSVWPGGGPAPDASTLNWSAGATVANQIVMGVASDGTFSVRNNSGNVHVVVDVVAWLGPDPVGGVGCTLIDPVRVLDTRDGVGVPAGPAQAGVELTLGLAGHSGIVSPTLSTAFTTTTVTGGTAASHLTVWPTGTAMPDVSSLNWTPGETVPNHVVAPTGDDGAVTYANHAGAVDLIVDLTGWC